MSNRDIPIDFNSFVVSLASSAMLYLGETPHPESGKAEKNLPLARNTIEVLAMLQDKTQGNLDEEEANLLSTLVDDLRGKLDAVG